MAKQWKKDTARWAAFGDRLREVLATAEHMGGMPGAVAADAVATVAYVLEPLRELEHVPVPEGIRAHGRAWREAAQVLAADPTREHATAWVNAGRRLRGEYSVQNMRFRDAARRAASAAAGPPPTVNIGDHSPGLLAQREQEKMGHRFIKQGGGQR